MTDRQPGWHRVKFGDVVMLNKERCANPLEAGIERYVGLEHIEPDDLRIRRWGIVAEGTTFTNLFRPGQVLFGKRRAYQRKVAVADFTGVCSGDIYAFASKDPGVLLPELLPFICQTDGFFAHAVGTSAGSLSPRTNWTQLAQYEFALPPLDEQRRLAEVLTATNDWVELLTESVRAYDQLLVAFLDAMASGGSATRLFRLGELLDTVIDFRGRTPKKLGMDWGGGTIPALSAMNVKMGYIDFSLGTNYGSSELYEKWMTQGDIMGGDLIFTTEAPLGNVVLVDSNKQWLLSQRVVALRPNRAQVVPEYLYAYIRSKRFQSELVRLSTGSTAKGIRVANLVTIPVPIPCLSEQYEIAEQAREIWSCGALLDRRLADGAQMVQLIRNYSLGSVDTF